MTNPPSNPSDWLLFLASLADRHPLEPITPAGEDLQQALVGFLKTGGAGRADLLDLRADFISIVPRFFNALVQAGQNGDAQGGQFVELVELLFNEIIRDADELAARQENERKH